MYRVTQKRHIRLDGGRSVVLQEGPRGLSDDGVDRDEGLRKALPAEVLAALIEDGTIVEE